LIATCLSADPVFVVYSDEGMGNVMYAPFFED
jgi:hypothetical protein